MFQTKKDLDKHVRSCLSRLRDNEKHMRGYTFAKQYFKIGEYKTAEHYVSLYLSANENNAAAHKLRGQCLEKLRKPDQQLLAYQRSLELDKNQPDLLIEVCKLMLMDEVSGVTAAKARSWYELAESRNVQDAAVLSLKLKYMNGGANTTDILMNEIVRRPLDVGLRVRLVRKYIEQNRIEDAFKYAYDIEMKQNAKFRNSIDWYVTVGQTLAKYKTEHETHLDKDWSYWLLLVCTLDRHLFLSLAHSSNDSADNARNLAESGNLLFELDQALNKVVSKVAPSEPDTQLGGEFASHFRGQFCLHAATLLFKRELVATARNHWRDTTKSTLPLLLLAHNFGRIDKTQLWLKNSTESARQLIALWSTESRFRCAQAGRTLLSCIDSPPENTALNNLRKMINEKLPTWTTCDDVLNEIRRSTTDTDWRKRLHRQLFIASEQQALAVSSHFVKSSAFEKPEYIWPQISELQADEEAAQSIEPGSLARLVYLTLGYDATATAAKSTSTTISPEVRCRVFTNLNFSIPNLINCSAETLNQLDIDTFLYAAAIQAKRTIDVERLIATGNDGVASKPRVLPYANMAHRLCTEEQANWWTAAHKVYNNISGDELAELRATLQYGIEAVRGCGSPRMDLLILLKLGQLFCQRTRDATKAVERGFLEARSEALFKFSLSMLRMQDESRSSASVPFRRLFKYTPASSQFEIDAEVNALAEEAITFLADRYFKSKEFEECIEDLSGIRLPFATYFQAESYRKLTELSNTPKKNKRVYLDRAREFLAQTLDLLEAPNVDKNHPLKAIVDEDIKRLHTESRKIETSQTMSDSFVSANGRSDLDDSVVRVQREAHSSRAPVIVNANNEKLERMIVEMMESLTLLKEDVTDIRSKLNNIEEQIAKQQDSKSLDPLDEYYDEDRQDDTFLSNASMYPMYTNRTLNALQQQQQQQQRNAAAAFMYSNYQSLGLNQTAGLNPYQAAALANAASMSRNSLPPQMQMPFAGAQLPYGGEATLLGLLQQQQPPPPPQLQMQPPQMQPPQMQPSSQLPQPSLPQLQPQMQPQLQTHLQPQLAPAVQPQLQPQIPTQPKLEPAASASITSTAHSTPKQWNAAFNNAPVEKGPPVNVVITSSDPLPAQNTSSNQLSFSVTIPPQHIKKTGPLLETKTTAESSPQKAAEAPKKNVFEGFSFGLSTVSKAAPVATEPAKPLFSFSNLAQTAASTGPAPTPAAPTASDANTSGHNGDEEYEPTAHFEPVIALPDLIEVKTGEEDEVALFEHRAKLLRFVKESKEWKDRGIGNMKVLVSKTDPNKVRLLMRREQVLKLCCNQMLAKDTKFVQLPNTDTALSWYGQDYSENELQVEMLAVRFKTAEICQRFHQAILDAQEKMRGGDDSPSGDNSSAPAAAAPTSKTDTGSQPKGFGDQFKPKAGSWTCEGCYCSNKATDVTCPACNTPKDKNAVIEKPQAAPTAASKFSFGTLASSATNTAPKPAENKADKGFGDLFKPKAGSWTCQECYCSNAATYTNCPACSAPKDKNAVGEQPKVAAQPATPKFRFGVLNAVTAKPTEKAAPTEMPQNIFGTPTGSAQLSFTFGNLSKTTTSTPTTSASTFEFKPTIPPAAAPAPVPSTIGSEEFSFVFKPRSPAKGKSPLKQHTSTPGVEDVSDDENVEEEENQTYFTPVIPLPDKIEVKTGEEDENELYSHRAKLFRFRDSEWRERGLGNVRILQHKVTGRLRVVMRREQILKICLNHALTRDIEYKRKDKQSWFFVVNDFSEGTTELEQFSLRFKTEEIAQEFKCAIDDALSGVTSKQNGVGNTAESTTTTTTAAAPRDALASKLSAEETKKIADLQLPNDFFDYKSKPGCNGCRGCNSDEFVFPEVKDINMIMVDMNPIPLSQPHYVPSNNLSKNTTTPSSSETNPTFSFNSFTNASTAKTTPKAEVTSTSTTSSPFGKFNLNTSSSEPSVVKAPVFSFSNSQNIFGSPKDAPSFSFGGLSIFGTASTEAATVSSTTTSVTSSTAVPATKPFFGSFSAAAPSSTTTSIFGGFGAKPAETVAEATSEPKKDTATFTFKIANENGVNASASPFSPVSVSTPVTAETNTPEESKSSSGIFGGNAGLSFASLTQKTTPSATPEAIPDLSKSAVSQCSFASLAAQANNSGSAISGQSALFNTSGNNAFIGLSTRDDFSSFGGPRIGAAPATSAAPNVADNDNENVVDDANYDPHYEPIIELPDEIEVSTGEENEKKLFGERAKLYRFDAVNKEWKERGVGEFKVLHHPGNNSYRFLLRREQIYKLVLNMALSVDFQMNPMKQSDKAFCWVATNFAEDAENGALESLSVRFRNPPLAKKFQEVVNECVAQLKARGELEPEDD